MYRRATLRAPAPPRRQPYKASRIAAGAVALLTFGQFFNPDIAAGQALERNLPAAPPQTRTVLPATAATTPSNDDTPVGATLVALVVLVGDSPAQINATAQGLVVPPGTRLADHADRRRLLRFLGRPLSRKLISQIETTIVRAYRRQGFPFVAVSTPEQEITQGILQVRVVEFRAGALSVSGIGERQAARVLEDVRLTQGEPINAEQLLEDLDWLNRYPFRSVQPQLKPGAGFGSSDLTLVATTTKPWNVYAGYANSGTASTGVARYFVGGSIGGLAFPDSLIAAQVTGSHDFWWNRTQPFGNLHPEYESGALNLTLPVAPRQEIEASLNAVESNEPVQVFMIRQQTVEASIDYRTALSNYVAAPGDLAVGFEFAAQMRHTFFGPLAVVNTRQDALQFFATWSHGWTDGLGDSQLGVTLHGSPGSLERYDTSDDFLQFSNGRTGRATYVYADLDYTHAATLPAGFSLSSHLSAQYAGGALPASQQMGIGGPTLVRGYSLDDGAFDDGAILTNQLSPPVAIVRRAVPAISLAPYAFLDGGVGYDESAHRATPIGSTGLGVNANLGVLAAGFAADYALMSGSVTRSGHWRIDANLSVAF
jgi:hemolysin activation/secretion protein